MGSFVLRTLGELGMCPATKLYSCRTPQWAWGEDSSQMSPCSSAKQTLINLLWGQDFWGTVCWAI